MNIKRSWRDARGRKNSGYIHKRVQKTDDDNCVASIEESLYHYCQKHGINFRTLLTNRKCQLIIKVFGKSVYREYARALSGRKNIDFQKGG